MFSLNEILSVAAFKAARQSVTLTGNYRLYSEAIVGLIGMESNLSHLSSLAEEDNPMYIQPHYKESYRLAIYALLCGGREAYEEFLRAEQISPFLSNEEILFILENGELPEVEDDFEMKRTMDTGAPSTYFPSESDEEVPDLELGWPEVSLEASDTSISLLFNPPRINTPSIKEVVRKQIQDAHQVKTEPTCI